MDWYPAVIEEISDGRSRGEIMSFVTGQLNKREWITLRLIYKKINFFFQADIHSECIIYIFKFIDDPDRCPHLPRRRSLPPIDGHAVAPPSRPPARYLAVHTMTTMDLQSISLQLVLPSPHSPSSPRDSPRPSATTDRARKLQVQSIVRRL